MSKTKEEILLEKIDPSYPSFQEYLKFASPERTGSKIHEAMDTYAQQKVDEFKEKLKEAIGKMIKSNMENPTDSEAADYGYMTAIQEFEKLLL